PRARRRVAACAASRGDAADRAVRPVAEHRAAARAGPRSCLTRNRPGRGRAGFEGGRGCDDDVMATPGTPFTGRTAWVRNLETPLRGFLRTETGSAAVLLAAAVAALVWANVDVDSYERVWTTTFSITVGGHGISHDLRYWLNSGLMTLFFFVVGLEARREFDMGELRERRRASLPLAAGIGGMIVPLAIFLPFHARHESAHRRGGAMSTATPPPP